MTMWQRFNNTGLMQQSLCWISVIVTPTCVAYLRAPGSLWVTPKSWFCATTLGSSCSWSLHGSKNTQQGHYKAHFNEGEISRPLCRLRKSQFTSSPIMQQTPQQNAKQRLCSSRPWKGLGLPFALISEACLRGVSTHKTTYLLAP